MMRIDQYVAIAKQSHFFGLELAISRERSNYTKFAS